MVLYQTGINDESCNKVFETLSCPILTPDLSYITHHRNSIDEILSFKIYRHIIAPVISHLLMRASLHDIVRFIAGKTSKFEIP